MMISILGALKLVVTMFLPLVEKPISYVQSANPISVCNAELIITKTSPVIKTKTRRILIT